MPFSRRTQINSLGHLSSNHKTRSSEALPPNLQEKAPPHPRRVAHQALLSTKSSRPPHNPWRNQSESRDQAFFARSLPLHQISRRSHYSENKEETQDPSAADVFQDHRRTIQPGTRWEDGFFGERSERVSLYLPAFFCCFKLQIHRPYPKIASESQFLKSLNSKLIIYFIPQLYKPTNAFQHSFFLTHVLNIIPQALDPLSIHLFI